jgi:acyl-CoA synthetase (AMP-forming)/AMP-acid ligase II
MHPAENLATLLLMVRVGPASAGRPGPDVPELEDLLSRTPSQAAEPRPGSDQIFMYTGGTTGKPKGVIWRQADLLHSLAVPIFRPLGVNGLPATLDEAVEIAVEARAGNRAPATMPVVPLMHATGLFNSMAPCWSVPGSSPPAAAGWTRDTPGRPSPGSRQTRSSWRATRSASRRSTS